MNEMPDERRRHDIRGTAIMLEDVRNDLQISSVPAERWLAGKIARLLVIAKSIRDDRVDASVLNDIGRFRIAELERERNDLLFRVAGLDREASRLHADIVTREAAAAQKQDEEPLR